jgi:ABC-type multidrug transport system fused ATPase/permease subunit
MIVIAGTALLMAGREGGLSTALPVLGALALGAQRLLPLLQQIYQGWTSLSGNRAVGAQVLNLLSLPIAQEKPAVSVTPLRFERCIQFEAVSFAYPARSRAALEDIDLTLPHGARIALIGRTGSGKSTLADLLMGLLEPTAGRITIDGVALTESTRRAWQQSIAHVPQSIFLADASIAHNIALGLPSEEVDMERVRAAAKCAQLDEHIESLPEGYLTAVGERGVRLSGGQRQRLGLARAIYKQAPVLVLDEATSALDHETEQAVMRALDELGREGQTIVIIAHRRSTLVGCDLIVRVEDGRVAEIGSG